MSVTTEGPAGATAFRPIEVNVSEADLDDLRATHCHIGLALTRVRTGLATDGSERHMRTKTTHKRRRVPGVAAVRWRPHERAHEDLVRRARWQTTRPS
jgi:hypothetical protein